MEYEGINILVSNVRTLGIQAKELNLGVIKSENLVSHGLRDLYVPFGKFLADCNVIFSGDHRVLLK